MKVAKATFVAALVIVTTSAVAPRIEAAPMPSNFKTLRAALDTSIMQVRYGGWRGGWGYRGWGGHRGWGYRGGGYGGWGLGGVAAGAIVGGAIASSTYYGGAYPYYGGGYAYGSGYASDYCSPDGYGGYSGRQYDYGW